jgi:hypothetical protein
MTRVHRGRWTVCAPTTKGDGDMYHVSAKDETAKGGGFAVEFTGTRRELVALRTALAAAITTPKRGTR